MALLETVLLRWKISSNSCSDRAGAAGSGLNKTTSLLNRFFASQQNAININTLVND